MDIVQTTTKSTRVAYSGVYDAVGIITNAFKNLKITIQEPVVILDSKPNHSSIAYKTNHGLYEIFLGDQQYLSGGWKIVARVLPIAVWA